MLDFFLKIKESKKKKFYYKKEIQSWSSCELGREREKKRRIRREWEKARDWENGKVEDMSHEESKFWWHTVVRERVKTTWNFIHSLYKTKCYCYWVQSLSHGRLFATPWTVARQASLSITNSQSSLKLTSIESVVPSSHLILCRPLLLLPPTPPSIRVFSNESTLHMRWPKFWSFSSSISPSKEHPRLISFIFFSL